MPKVLKVAAVSAAIVVLIAATAVVWPALAQRLLTPDQYETEILKTQQEIQDLQNEIAGKLGMSAVLIVAFPEEVPLWIACLEKLHQAKEEADLNDLLKKLKYDKETYLPAQWAGLAHYPAAYKAFEKFPKIQTYNSRQARLRQQGRNMQRPKACPKPGQGSAQNPPPNTECYALSVQVCRYENAHTVIPQNLREEFYACIQRAQRHAKAPIRLAC